MGFCLLNNVAVTAAHLRDRGERVVIVDWDAHHGNGTQDMFWSDPDVMYVSMHEWPLYPGTGRLDDVGILATPLEYHVPKLPGLGDIHWGKFFSTLTDIGYTGPVCIEVEDRAYETTLATRQSALRQTRTYLRQYLPPATPS
jgi:acetoin utilization deacetylase AcuC-like enzyme